ncbi:SH3 domain-containing protein [Planococcus sp. CP5-4]|uniref:SH3 domain-containing protein n=1 Tax=unclassified Planococcus (in: firmicutes) TaxID=2662419 RepID=UPI001C24B792|nr:MULTISPECIES: SH3 domain-containing protein [unclassified Planococcus (in: firmicutes)]MBU9672866.1 SH3 domain-containing protein [Planococcus sp. CP5-4_YE]MBV0908638.1 SH3 domain-containing protein [Planococcus sp. CP5-4_UN]MBW6063407.1 SH3 domain-containing protein [Planococcus sp. CP5-4]
MQRRLILTLLVFILALSGTIPLAVTNPAHADNGEVSATGSTVNIRTGPGLSYEVIGSMKQGDKAQQVSRNGDWIEIRHGNTEGWVASWLVSTEPAQNTSAQTAISSVDSLNIRAQADLSSAVLSKMNAGEQAQVIASHGDWTEVHFRNVRGFVSTQYISLTEQKAAAPDDSAGEQQEQAAQALEKLSSFRIAVDALNVRAEPSLNAKIQASVKEGQVFNVKGMDGNWVQLELIDGKTGWVYAFYGELSDQPAQKASSSDEQVTVLTDGTNLRAQANTSSEVVTRADAGMQLSVAGKEGQWYLVALEDGRQAYIADWVVRTGTSTEPAEAEQQPARKAGTLNGLTIVLDPGHGGNDGGTVGVRKTNEKDLTLKTAEILSHHLRSAGAEVVMTRQSDVYVDLRHRVSESHQVAADAFISIHYDATEDSTVSGFTSYYQHPYQQKLAEHINGGLAGKLTLDDRGARKGNYLVLRDNRQAAVLVELGFLSNFNEERIVSSDQFRQQAALGLYNGIISYFDSELSE